MARTHGGRARRTTATRLLLVSLTATVTAACAAVPSSPPNRSASAQPSSVTPLAGDLPLLFIENVGQAPDAVSHYLQGAQTSVSFTPTGLTLAPTGPDGAGGAPVTVTFDGAEPTRPTGIGTSDTSVNYLVGSESSWRRDVPVTTSLEYDDLWPGIDLVYTGAGSALKYTFHVHPGADASQIALAYRGATDVEVTPAGDLEVTTGDRSFVDERPVAWQEVDGIQVPVAVKHSVDDGPDAGVFTARLPVGDYDHSRELVVDPTVLIYAGYLGGSGEDSGQSIAVDGDASVYVTGDTTSPGQGTPGAFDSASGSPRDAYIAKVTPDGSNVVYLTYVGGGADDVARSIAVDGDGSAYITGGTTSADFPVPSVASGLPAYDHAPPVNGGDAKAYVFKLSPDGSARDYATYLNATNSAGRSIVVDGGGNAFVAGAATALIATPGAFDTTPNGGADAIVVKLNPGGTSALYATYLGGAQQDIAFGIDVNPEGTVAFVTGSTRSTAFPATPTFTGSDDAAFVTRLTLAPSSPLTYSRLINGTPNLGTEVGRAIAVDFLGNAIVVGESTSATTPSGTSRMGTADGFVVKLDPTGAFTTTRSVGGMGADGLNSVAVDGRNNIYVAGVTSSTVTVPPLGTNVTGTILSAAPAGNGDAFVIKYPPTLVTPTYGGYFGGVNQDVVFDVTADWGGFAYLAGFTRSPGLSTNGRSYSALTDAFFAKIGPECTWSDTSGLDYYASVNNTDDVICGLDGNDTIQLGGGGNDIVIGGPGKDTLSTGDGNDILDGGDGDDTLSPGVGNDMVFGATGDDLIDGNEGDDAIDGGTGNDTIEGGWGPNVVRGGGGEDSISNFIFAASITDGGGPGGTDACVAATSLVVFCSP